MRVFARRREDGYLHRFLTRTRLELCQGAITGCPFHSEPEITFIAAPGHVE